jgi:hypothetical protein
MTPTSGVIVKQMVEGSGNRIAHIRDIPDAAFQIRHRDRRELKNVEHIFVVIDPEPRREDSIDAHAELNPNSRREDPGCGKVRKW